MNEKNLRIAGQKVTIRFLPSGDMSVWHPYDERVRQVVEPICQGHGHWDPEYTNWVIFARHREFVLAELQRAGRPW